MLRFLKIIFTKLPICLNIRDAIIIKKKKILKTSVTDEYVSVKISILQLRTYSSYATLSLALQTHYAIVDLQKLRSI